MPERVLFLTGHLAHGRLERVLAGLGPMPFEWRVHNIGVKVAALMTGEIIRRRLPRPVEADRIIVPGRCHADVGKLSADLGMRVERGPDEITDLPRYLGAKGKPPDLARYDIRLFAEIVDAATIDVTHIVLRAEALKAAGADVIDLGCLPDTPFPHLQESVRELKHRGFVVSVGTLGKFTIGGREASTLVDRMVPCRTDDLEPGRTRYVLSLDEATIALAEGTSCIPVLVPRPHGDLASLIRAAEAAKARGIACILDPILDPIHFGFSDSLARYVELRRHLPDAEMMMGTGNLTELTEADTSGITAVLLGIWLHRKLTAVRSRLVGDVADRVPCFARARWSNAGSGCALAADDDVRRGAGTQSCARHLRRRLGERCRGGCLARRRAHVVLELVVGLFHQCSRRRRRDRAYASAAAREPC